MSVVPTFTRLFHHNSYYLYRAHPDFFSIVTENSTSYIKKPKLTTMFSIYLVTAPRGEFYYQVVWGEEFDSRVPVIRSIMEFS